MYITHITLICSVFKGDFYVCDLCSYLIRGDVKKFKFFDIEVVNQ